MKPPGSPESAIRALSMGQVYAMLILRRPTVGSIKVIEWPQSFKNFRAMTHKIQKERAA